MDISTLNHAVLAAKPYLQNGRVADYIPALREADAQHLGVAVADTGGAVIGAGDCQVSFSIQSVSKIFSLACVLRQRGLDAVLQHVGMEPSGNPFYSLVQLEYESGKPRNPFINAGAIAVTSLLPGQTAGEKSEFLCRFLSEISGTPIAVNEKVYFSEYETSHRNRAVAHFMKHFGNLEGNVEEAVNAYFQQCSITMDAVTLARLGLFLAHHGTDPVSGKTIVDAKSQRFLLAMMTMCGLYDASGEFAVRVGLPAKSGVGGGIFAVVPGRYTIVTFGPALDDKGNSIGGIQILEHLSSACQLSSWV